MKHIHLCCVLPSRVEVEGGSKIFEKEANLVMFTPKSISPVSNMNILLQEVWSSLTINADIGESYTDPTHVKH